MLELKKIQKVYPAGDGNVTALKGVSLCFRENEFVSILGPSGCGKTTLLNLIGGLDQYTSGDLVINGKSTKDFKNRDWDTYRNHSVGFVFQSYNLIPHQTVLQNVELALTLSGVSKKERRNRAKVALAQVGLSDQLRKKPGEMSGGQMQRVAIARALVNNPDIILADEPTGALDTETSVQVMELLKEVAKDRLVIMVTHNPELAERYSTRIIRMLDGNIIGDTCPLTQEETEVRKENASLRTATEGKIKKPSMSLWTAFGLSLKNLFTKKGRTVLTSFAGSIGIIGIALILAVSTGMKTYIDTVQEETLSSYPLTLQSQHVDLASMMQAFAGAAQSKHEHDLDAVYQKSIIMDLVNALSSTEIQENDLASFKVYLEQQMKENKKAQTAISGIQYTYDLDLTIYTQNVEGKIVHSDSEELMTKMLMQYMGATMGSVMGSGDDAQSGNSSDSMMSSMNMMGSSGMWQEMLSGNDGAPINDMIYKQYDLVYGSWPNSYDEIVLIVDENNELDDLTLYALGLKTQADIDKIMQAAINKTELKEDLQKWSYEEICGREFKVILNSDCYYYSADSGICVDLRETTQMFESIFNTKAIPLRVTGIIRPNEDSASHMISGSIGYTKMLTQHVIEKAQASETIKAQLANPGVDIFTGLPFKDADGLLSDEKKAADFMAYVAELTQEEQGELYIQIHSIPTPEELAGMVAEATQGKTREDMETLILDVLSEQYASDAESLGEYIGSLNDEALADMFKKIMEEVCKAQYGAMKRQYLQNMPFAQRAALLTAELAEATDMVKGEYYDLFLEFSESDYETNLIRLGCLDLDAPSGINLYASSFENKDEIEALIAAYNKDKDEVSQIAYTDFVGILMSSVTTIIDAISYVLIAFVSISLVVSSIMIGVITLISVQERTKEIGILRAIGASKGDVSSMFNAETVIIGFTSGLLGVGITYLLCIPINAIIQALTGIGNLRAFLPVGAACILVLISILLTLFSGLIPSRSAAKKDPVVALRTE